MHIDATTEDGVKVETVVSITPEDFRSALLPYYKRCKKIVDQVLTSVPNNANMMLLVGGSTKHQMLIEMLEHDYPQFQLNPGVGQDLAVSLGASIKGKISKFGDDAVQIFDVLPITIGIRTGDTLSQLLTAGTTLPATQTIPFTTVVDNQTSMTVEVLQGNTSNPDDCVSLGMLTLQDIPKKPAGEPNLFVTLGNNVDVINKKAFIKCKKLKKVVIGKNITTIKKQAFFNLKKILEQQRSLLLRQFVVLLQYIIQASYQQVVILYRYLFQWIIQLMGNCSMRWIKKKKRILLLLPDVRLQLLVKLGMKWQIQF